MRTKSMSMAQRPSLNVFQRATRTALLPDRRRKNAWRSFISAVESVLRLLVRVFSCFEGFLRDLRASVTVGVGVLALRGQPVEYNPKNVRVHEIEGRE